MVKFTCNKLFLKIWLNIVLDPEEFGELISLVHIKWSNKQASAGVADEHTSDNAEQVELNSGSQYELFRFFSAFLNFNLGKTLLVVDFVFFSKWCSTSFCRDKLQEQRREHKNFSPPFSASIESSSVTGGCFWCSGWWEQDIYGWGAILSALCWCLCFLKKGFVLLTKYAKNIVQYVLIIGFFVESRLKKILKKKSYANSFSIYVKNHEMHKLSSHWL